MRNKLGLNLNIKPQQKLIITPQMRLSLSVLQMNISDILLEINSTLQSNPLLEESYDIKNIDYKKNKNEIYYSNLGDFNYKGVKTSYSKNDGENEYNYENFVSSKQSLEEHLLFQLNISGLKGSCKEIAEYIIGNLDDNGFFKLDISSVAQYFKVSEDEVVRILRIVQDFDPPGIASRNLKECILNQLGELNISQKILKDIEKIIDLYESNPYLRESDIIEKLNLTDSYYNYLKNIINKADPKPGLSFGEQIKYIYPDVFIYKINNKLHVAINNKDIPPIRINNYYKKLVKQDNIDEKTKEYIAEKIKNAEWFIKSLYQRDDALVKVTKAIVDYQKDFFIKGFEYLKPMKLKDIAKISGLHESTVSRVVSGKYASTMYGVIELKMFFKKGFKTSDGSFSVDRVKELIKNIVKSEPSNDPYSDSTISSMLTEYGLKIARRTVAKYREELNIPSKKYRRKERSSNECKNNC
ncbi:MAG: RNA polymerase factor sigma-54 [Deferribacterota bacterium]|nr:RNA polymerase factor sigma-54 [Deferribacterota bacterium]